MNEKRKVILDTLVERKLHIKRLLRQTNDVIKLVKKKPLIVNFLQSLVDDN